MQPSFWLYSTNGLAASMIYPKSHFPIFKKGVFEFSLIRRFPRTGCSNCQAVGAILSCSCRPRLEAGYTHAA